MEEREVTIEAGSVSVTGSLHLAERASGMVLFAHGSGSSRFSPRNRFVASVLQRAGMATLLLDLLTSTEEASNSRTALLRFDIGLLAGRLMAASDWLARSADTGRLPLGYFGASTGAAAALAAAAQRPAQVKAVVSRGGRPDLAQPQLSRVQAPTLLIVGSNDYLVLEMNRQALAELRVESGLETVPGATHLFEEPGALERVAELARDWFQRYLAYSCPSQAA